MQQFPPQPQQQPQQQHQPQQYPNEPFMGPPAVPYSGSTESVSMTPSGQSMPSGSAGYPGHHGQPPPPPQSGQYSSSGAPYMPMQHPRGMAPGHPNVSQHQQSASNSSEISDDRGTTAPTHTVSYYPPSAAAPVPSASPSTASVAYNQPRATGYPVSGYQSQVPSTASASIPTPDGNSRLHQGPSREPMMTGDGQPAVSQASYPNSSSAPIPQQSAPPAVQSSSGPSMATSSGQGQNAYSNQMASPNGSGYQPVQYSHDSANSSGPAPPNQYITPQGPRYHGQASSTALSDAAPASGMISHAYR